MPFLHLTGRRLTAILLLFCGIAASPVHAQWTTQSFELKAGYNAIYLHVDASHATLNALIASDSSNPIRDIWRWNPAASTLQFVDSPQSPNNQGSQFTQWSRSDPNSLLQRMSGNSAYLVRVDGQAGTYTWNLKGRPIPPRYDWTTSGLNFVGFPTVPANPVTFEKFFLPAPGLLPPLGEIFLYPGGDPAATKPVPLLAAQTTPVARGRAYWMRSGKAFNRYFGPFELLSENAAGVLFGDTLGQNRIRLRNATGVSRTVTLNLLPSETPPAGESNIVALPPLLVRGAPNSTNLTPYTSLNVGQQTWVLAPQGQPGSEAEIILGLNRAALTNTAGIPYPAGTFFAGILRFADTAGLTQMDVGVSASAGSASGLWVGGAEVTQVAQYLVTYLRDADNRPVQSEQTAGGAAYVALATNTAMAATSRSFPLRLIIHNNGAGNARLLQRVYHGQRLGNPAVVSRESLLDVGKLASARRISAAHLPFSAANISWPMVGQLRQGGTLSVSVPVDYSDQAANPFLHTYHPDHDNLDPAGGAVLPQGAESFRVERQLTLSVTRPLDDFDSLTRGSQQLNGNYLETITLSGHAGHSRRFQVSGFFLLNRISPIDTLTTN